MHNHALICFCFVSAIALISITVDILLPRNIAALIVTFIIGPTYIVGMIFYLKGRFKIH